MINILEITVGLHKLKLYVETRIIQSAGEDPQRLYVLPTIWLE